MNTFVLVAPLAWMLVCISYFAMTSAEPTRIRFAVAFGPSVLVFLVILFEAVHLMLI